MYLSELNLQGFKSFANKTAVKFDSGITSIVGPNGCGKSNIVDALRWVLGEQRASLLRSSAMQNVIFNGTSTRKALGMAEVSLTIENNKGILPVEYTDITITRRLFRSGESEYLLNGSTCRLKDIVELFMDTGMGPGAYSVIELKMVEEILNDKNNDRRRLFEEAAGVTRYKEKRKQTLRKLDDTVQNLTRVDDLLVEIRKKVRSLQNQASRAQRAKEYQEKLRNLELAFTKYEHDRMQEELKPVRERIIEAEKEKQAVLQHLDRLSEEEKIAREKLDAREQALSEARLQMSSVMNRIRENETTIRINKEKINNEKEVILQFERDIEQAENDITDYTRSKVSAEKVLAERSEELKKAEKELAEIKEKFNQANQEAARLRKESSEINEKQNRLNEDLNRLQSAKIRLESRQESVSDDLERIRKEQEKARSHIETSREELERLTKESDKAKKERDDAERELESLRKNREKATARINELKDRLREERSSADSLKSERELVQQIANSQDVFPGSVRFLKGKKQNFKRLQVLSDVFATDEKHAVALEAALGEAVNYLVVENVDEAENAVNLLRENGKGRAAVIPLDQFQNGMIKAKPVPGSIAKQVNCPDECRLLCDYLLANICLTDSVKDGMARAIKENVTCVTLSGDVVFPGGILKSGSKDKNIGVRVGLKDRIKNLDKEISKAEKALAKTESEIESVQQELSGMNEQIYRERLREADGRQRRADQQKTAAESQAGMHSRALGDLEKREADLKNQQVNGSDELESLEPKMNEIRENLKQFLEDSLTLRSKLKEAEEARHRTQSVMQDSRVAEQRLRSESESYRREISQSEQSIKTIKDRLEVRAGQAKRSREKIIELTETTEGREADLKQLQEERKKASENLEQTEEATSKQRGRIRSIEEESKNQQRKKDINTDILHQLEINQNRLEMQLKTVEDHIWETYGLVVGQIDQEMPEDTDPGTVKSTISGLRERLKNIGEVNPLAIEEYEEEKERLSFYEEQINDLREAEEKLRSTIREINQTAQQRFNETFKEIRENFRKVFNLLFEEDDECDLVLDHKDDDPLEHKIGIIAKPRGKRPSSIEQLSGGEKTLTAIALLFAIYLVKPSPFCILDEVDAPLDDANIGRFTNLIRQFSDETQFIIITHNKKTMDKSEVMYGVTMQETGISRLVGVKLEGLEA